ncbi:MAG TPA: quinolinate synthase [Hyphomonadaceae bacterium]|nr:quinolinate synthase NadA [Ponticaulis sp.]MAJ08818.1 quinolinate synthase [Ponticaulis sp.]MDF1681049.1 quinolinate synthase NadA [Ponticaulis sp.]RPG17512.1 MAG: quinolinate synthase NadA [Hyphomonadaceae bacterium TMED125]HBJ94623.1 quinolinate synthase [Hyphomonadaceae bacterium]|tara:strand:+ start:2393 stop:3541 length:1149 start_codon:yes stop_codon:yes gene_type:complete
MARIIDTAPGCDMPALTRTPTALEARGLSYNDEVKAATDHLYEEVKDFITPMEWPGIAPLVHGINKLKTQRNAVVLAHNYMTPDIFNLVGDFRGDSLQLAREAANVDAEVIVQAGVHFMAETSKILAPEKTVLIPDMEAGCSLAESITGADIRLIKQKYPGIPVVTYVNTTADVKAETDVCCTSSNAVQVVEHVAAEWGVDKVILIPDKYLARNVAAVTDIEIITWDGRCEVHEQFTADDIHALRDAHPGVLILAHPECPPDVLEASDFAGSTSALSNYVSERSPNKVVLLTECSMSDNVASANPDVEFVKPCNLCPHMKRITLENIFDALTEMKHEVLVDEDVRVQAKKAIDAMLALPNPKTARPFETGLAPKDIETLSPA